MCSKEEKAESEPGSTLMKEPSGAAVVAQVAGLDCAGVEVGRAEERRPLPVRGGRQGEQPEGIEAEASSAEGSMVAEHA